MLGTSKFLRNGSPNPYFNFRVDAAVHLIKNKKVDFIIVSGDNKTEDYNEPKQMRKALITAGVDPKKIVMDYAGFRTLDSVIRAKEVFGQDKFIIISQKFHIERAIFIGRSHGINAYGYCANDVPIEKGYYVHIREIFARLKMFLDLYIIHKEPKFLGKKEKIEDQ
ncbi:ElyC/SanA/YdcF family protein [Flammeovirga sp. SubArs3]|uniref:SanA/YdcF family protein n=1 Tax=Flammeovirga sp. SubArs3 TaxID=2995316 RepID=UPI00248B8613|nr:ElyC/SanA/YdcF family protein [Flammeovirga sp. SubArs3]